MIPPSRAFIREKAYGQPSFCRPSGAGADGIRGHAGVARPRFRKAGSLHSKGNAADRTLYVRRIVDGQMQAEEKICHKGPRGGDIQGVLSHDGKWLAFARSMGDTSGGFGGDDYHSFGKCDIYIVSLEGGFPNQPIVVAQGYFPCWGDDSDGSTKVLYY